MDTFFWWLLIQQHLWVFLNLINALVKMQNNKMIVWLIIAFGIQINQLVQINPALYSTKMIVLGFLVDLNVFGITHHLSVNLLLNVQIILSQFQMVKDVMLYLNAKLMLILLPIRLLNVWIEHQIQLKVLAVVIKCRLMIASCL